MTTTIAETRGLTDLVNTARDWSLTARLAGERRIAYGLLRIAEDLDSARTCLVHEGGSYLDAAWAFVDAGRGMVADYATELARAGVVRP